MALQGQTQPPFQRSKHKRPRWHYLYQFLCIIVGLILLGYFDITLHIFDILVIIVFSPIFIAIISFIGVWYTFKSFRRTLASGSVNTLYQISNVPREKPHLISRKGEQLIHSVRGIFRKKHSRRIFLDNMPLKNPQEFHGRDLDREDLIQRTLNGGSSSIIGRSKIGKTWMIKYFILIAPTRLPDFHVIYVDPSQKSYATVAGFTENILKELHRIHLIAHIPGPGLEVLAEVLRDLKARKKTLVLCIDEYEGFRNSSEFTKDFFESLRSMTNEEGLVLIVSAKKSLKKDSRARESKFFNIFRQYQLKEFDASEAQAFIGTKSTQAGLTNEEQNLLRHYGKCHPCRLQMAGQLILDHKAQAAKGKMADYNPGDPKYNKQFEKELNARYRNVIQRA
jgi:AAA domain